MKYKLKILTAYYVQRFKDFLLYVWQFPQNIAGFVISRKARASNSLIPLSFKVRVYWVKGFFGSAVSLGQYIVIDEVFMNSKESVNIKKHEYGHSRQSVMLGWLYLPVVGLPSLVRNIYARLRHKDEKRYYGGFPENWADRLGGVER